MLSLDRRMSFDVEFNRVAIAVAEMLTRQMDDTFIGLVQSDETPGEGPQQRTAEVANRIVILCRRLVDEIRLFERWDQLRREHEQHEIVEEDMPF